MYIFYPSYAYYENSHDTSTMGKLRVTHPHLRMNESTTVTELEHLMVPVGSQ